jgi:two-component system, chemotaxis family, sensor kinase CheA
MLPKRRGRRDGQAAARTAGNGARFSIPFVIRHRHSSLILPIVSPRAALYIAPGTETGDPHLTDQFDLSGLIDEFRDEARGQIELLDSALLALEREGGIAPEATAALQRALHTLKGNSGMLGYTAVRDYVHAVESVFRSPPPRWPQALLDRLFEGAATLRRAVEQVGTGDEAAALARLAALPPPDAMVGAAGEAAAEPHAEAAEPAEADDRPAAPPPEAEAADDAEPARVGVSTELLRVRFEKLDALASLVAELVAVHAALEDLVARNRAALDGVGLRRPLQRIEGRFERIATALRDASTDLRLVPVRRVFGRFPSLARDLAREQGKQVRVVLEGEDTGLDKSTVDVLAEPLLHLVRNAVDHGIGTPAEREAAGKPPHGTLTLRAAQSGDTVRITVEDDGRGLDHERILARARASGLVAHDETPSDDEVADLIFRPGFSTRSEVDTLSGRGIGMDVVASSVARLRGSLSVEDRPGEGTRFVLHLPLTVAMLPVVLFEAAGETLALPALEVEDARRLEGTAQMAGAEMVAYGDEWIPVARPERLFGWSDAPPGAGGDGDPDAAPAGAPPRAGYVVVIRRGTRAAAVTADRLLDQRDVVVKALPAALGQPAAVSGATIAPDGRVILLLDAGGILDLNLESHRRGGRGQRTGEDPDR